MEVIKIAPRGYCYGVVDALQLAKGVARDPATPKPVYVLGQIVHNRHAVEELSAYGVVTLDGGSRLELLEGIEGGTVVFTAHGVSPAVRRRAREKGLHCVDATCPDVTRTHELVRTLVAEGYEVIYIGRRGHPEPEGVVGEAPGHVHLIENQEDLDALVASGRLAGRPVAVSTQTTLSKWDTEALIEQVRRYFPGARVYNEICLATQLRQEAAVRCAAEADLVLVVGDRRSNNSNRLVQVVREYARRPAYLVDNVTEIDPAWLRGCRRVAVTAGSSTPSHLTRAVIRFLERFEPEAGKEPAGSIQGVDAGD